MMEESQSHQIRFQRAIVQLRDKDLNGKASGDNGTERNRGQYCKWNLKQLTLHPLGCREDASDFASAFIANFLFGLKLPALGLHG